MGRAAALATIVVVFVAACSNEATEAVSSTTVEPATTTTVLDLSAGIWRRVPHDEAVFGGDGNQVMQSVTVGGPGLVAVGYVSLDGDWDAAVWTSPDGINWTRVLDDSVFGGTGDQEMRSVTAGGPGLIAVGTDSRVGKAVWTSSDGLTWTRQYAEPDTEGTVHHVMDSVTVGGPALVAVGYDHSQAAVWTSPDGITWTRILDEAAFDGAGSQEMLSVTAGGAGVVAVGYTDSEDGMDAAAWASSDGITWTRTLNESVLGGTGDQAMLSVTARAPGLVAVGYESSAEHPDSSAAAVWTSTDGLTWTRVPFDEESLCGRRYRHMTAVAAAGPGLVAVGYDGPHDDTDAAVWTSPEGVTWSRLPHVEAVFGGPDDQRMLSVTAGGPGLIAVGYSGGGHGSGEYLDEDAAVWYWAPEPETPSTTIPPPQLTTDVQAELTARVIAAVVKSCTVETRETPLYVIREPQTWLSESWLDEDYEPEPMSPETESAIEAQCPGVQIVSSDEARVLTDTDAFMACEAGTFVWVGPVIWLADDVVGVEIGVACGPLCANGEIRQFRWTGTGWEPTDCEETGIATSIWIS
jgi:hypothetical protein